MGWWEQFQQYLNSGRQQGGSATTPNNWGDWEASGPTGAPQGNWGDWEASGPTGTEVTPFAKAVMNDKQLRAMGQGVQQVGQKFATPSVEAQPTMHPQRRQMGPPQQAPMGGMGQAPSGMRSMQGGMQPGVPGSLGQMTFQDILRMLQGGM